MKRSPFLPILFLCASGFSCYSVWYAQTRSGQGGLAEPGGPENRGVAPSLDPEHRATIATAEACFREAEVLIQRSEFEAVERLLGKARALDPSHPEVKKMHREVLRILRQAPGEMMPGSCGWGGHRSQLNVNLWRLVADLEAARKDLLAANFLEASRLLETTAALAKWTPEASVASESLPLLEDLARVARSLAERR
ncbi:MAG: hypothetical protein HYY18_04365 [Planctomycetes bacterium]|nr:hypothetical protein [Planctomycetota bacterium]